VRGADAVTMLWRRLLVCWLDRVVLCHRAVLSNPVLRTRTYSEQVANCRLTLPLQPTSGANATRWIKTVSAARSLPHRSPSGRRG
jgi:hypothetical protein